MLLAGQHCHSFDQLWAFSWFSTLVIVFNFTANTIRARQCKCFTTTKIDLTSHWMSLCIKFVSKRPTIKVLGRVSLPADEDSCRMESTFPLLATRVHLLLPHHFIITSWYIKTINPEWQSSYYFHSLKSNWSGGEGWNYILFQSHTIKPFLFRMSIFPF